MYMTKVYHGTGWNNANKIKEYGFKTPDVWVTWDKNLAESYANGFKAPSLMVLEIPIYRIIGGSNSGDEGYDEEFNFSDFKDVDTYLEDYDITDVNEFIEGLKEEYQQWLLDNTQDKPHKYIIDIVKL